MHVNPIELSKMHSNANMCCFFEAYVNEYMHGRWSTCYFLALLNQIKYENTCAIYFFLKVGMSETVSHTFLLSIVHLKLLNVNKCQYKSIKVIWKSKYTLADQSAGSIFAIDIQSLML